MQSHTSHSSATLGVQEINGDWQILVVGTICCLSHSLLCDERNLHWFFCSDKIASLYVSVLVLDLACKGPNKLLFPSCNCPCPPHFQREESENSVVVSSPDGSLRGAGSLCAEIRGALELIAGHVARLRTTNDNRCIPMCSRNKNALGGARISVGYLAM